MVELVTSKIAATKTAYGAFRVGTHDDLVTALGLAVQVDDLCLAGALPAIPGW